MYPDANQLSSWTTTDLNRIREHLVMRLHGDPARTGIAEYKSDLDRQSDIELLARIQAILNARRAAWG